MSLPIRFAACIAVILTLSLSACGKIDPAALFAGADKSAPSPAQTTRAGELDPIFADPQTGDLYAAELTYFSGYDFGEEDVPMFGLMRVVQVHPDRITLNTNTNAWSKARGAINDLRGNLSNVEWDEDENIEVYRNELPHLIAEKKILDARRD